MLRLSVTILLLHNAGVPQQSTTTQNPNNVSDPFSEHSATTDQFAASGGANQSYEQQQASFENPFQLDPFSFSPQSGGSASFQTDPGTDPFVIPPLPAGIEPAPGNTIFDDLGQLDSSTGGGFDIFNFGPPITTKAGPSASRQPTLPPVAGNPLSDVSNPTGLNFDVDLLDDRLFDTLAQLDIQDGSGGNEMKKDLARKGQVSADDEFEFSSPQPLPSFADAGSGVGASGGRKKQTQKLTQKLSQQDFDNLWDGICATLPTTDS